MLKHSLVLALFAAACGTTSGTPDGGTDDREACTTQSECSASLNRVCEDGYCSAELTQPTFVDTFLSIRPILLRQPKSFRAWVLYQVGPDGSPVRCDGLDATKLDDGSHYNRTARLHVNFTGAASDVMQTALPIDGDGRVVYVEVYSERVIDGQPGEEGPAVGTGCVENVQTTAKLTVDVKAKR